MSPATTLQRTVLCAVAVATLIACPRPPEEKPTRALREDVAPALGLEFKTEPTEGAERNFFGIYSEELLLSARTDSRTYFVQNRAWGIAREGGTFEGEDDELLGRCREIAEVLGIPSEEIAAASVAQVMSNTGTVDAATGEIRVGEPQKGERYAQLSRRIDGVPVFSSRVLLALDREGRIGFLELHWPEISDEVMQEARAMHELVERGWKPPEVEAARVEAVEAGIVHSPAVGFVMDIQPVIRVIYEPTDPGVGKKPMLYLNAEGQPAPMPRQFESLEVPPEKPRERASSEVEEGAD